MITTLVYLVNWTVQVDVPNQKKKFVLRKNFGNYDETSGRATRLVSRSSIELWLLFGLALLGVVMFDVVGLANRTPSYWTPFNSIVTPNCCSPLAALTDRKSLINSTGSIDKNFFFHLPRLVILNCIPDNIVDGPDVKFEIPLRIGEDEWDGSSDMSWSFIGVLDRSSLCNDDELCRCNDLSIATARFCGGWLGMSLSLSW